VTAILEKQGGVDLIAMGTHGRTGISAAVLGNVAYGVLKAADVPVLAIRHAQRKWDE
jgi:nucleotide-binding universal stress UspA family protein